MLAQGQMAQGMGVFEAARRAPGDLVQLAAERLSSFSQSFGSQPQPGFSSLSSRVRTGA